MGPIQEYLMLAMEVTSFDKYNQEKAVNKYNRKATQMRKLAVEIANAHPDLKYAFCELLSHEEKGVRIWVAHHILEVMNAELSFKKVALRVIRHKARTDKTIGGFGEKMWLKDWYKAHPKDRWI